MECRSLKMTVISAKGLNDINVFRKIDDYVDISLSSDNSNRKQHTSIYRDGSTNPHWGHTLAFTFVKATDRTGHLKIKIKAKCTLRRDKEISAVNVGARELPEKGGINYRELKVLT